MCPKWGPKQIFKNNYDIGKFQIYFNKMCLSLKTG